MTGVTREMHPMVRDEVYRIGYGPSATPARTPAATGWKLSSHTRDLMPAHRRQRRRHGSGDGRSGGKEGTSARRHA